MYKCECCGLEVKDIPEWEKDECPEDMYQHHFKPSLLPAMNGRGIREEEFYEIKILFDALDIRLITKTNAAQLAAMKHAGRLHFAFDFKNYEAQLVRGIKHLVAAGLSPSRLMFYIYLHDESHIQDAMHRWQVIREHSAEPFLMINRDNMTPRLKVIARRGCRPAIWRNLTTEEVFT